MGKRIIVMMCAIHLDNQRKILEGMIDAVRETDCNLFIITNYVSYFEKSENIKGAYQIMELPELREFDGAIIMRNSIPSATVADRAVNAILESGLPAVSIDVEVPGMSKIAFSSYEAQTAMVEHFINVHHCTDIYYISGPMFHKEGEKRYRAYIDTMKKYGLTVDEKHVFNGFFSTESGVDAVNEFLKEGSCPQAIVCGNDAMAVGALDELKRRGYRVPEDVFVAGFDNGELSELNSPQLTTVDKNQRETGYKAVYDILSQISGNETTSLDIEGKLVCRTSCGCSCEEKHNAEKLKERYVYNQVSTTRVSDIMRDMITEFSGMDLPEQIIESLRKYVAQMELDIFYLCMCDRDKLFAQKDEMMTGNLDILDVNSSYTDKIRIPLAYSNGEISEFGEFPKGKVLPDEIRNKSGGNYYIVTPINYRDCCFGYAVCGNNRLPIEHSLYYSWTMNIGIALENIRKRMLLEDTVKRLNGMWVYDMLTHLYNRAGFYHFSKPLLDKMKKKDEMAYLIFLDLDGLKLANDTLGHEAGDDLI